MISANRILLLRRLASTPPTLQQIGRRQHHFLSREVGCWNSSSQQNNNSINNSRLTTSRPTVVHVPTAPFWSWINGSDKKDETPTKADPETEKSDEDRKASTSDTVLGGSGEDASMTSADAGESQNDKSEEGDGVPPEEVSGKAADTTDGLGDKNDVVPPEVEPIKAADPPDVPEEKADDTSPEEFTAKSNKSTDDLSEKADKISLEEDSLIATDSTNMGGGANGVPSEETSTETTILTEGLDKKADDVPQEDMSTKSIDSAVGLDEKDDGIPANKRGFASVIQENAVTKNGEPIVVDKKEGGIPPKKESTGRPKKEATAVPPEEVIRTGTIKWINFQGRYGIIVQDRQFRKLGVKSMDSFFFFNEIYPEIREFVPLHDTHLITPIVNKEQRIQFQARAHERDGKKSLRAFNIRYTKPLARRSLVTQKGEIPMLDWPAALTLIRKSKARLGNDIYNILSAPEIDEKDRLKRMHNALDHCNRKIEWMRSQVTSEDVAKGCKTKLGVEIYDMLTDIANVDNVERRADEAYFNCLSDLSQFGIKLTQNQEEDLKGWVERRSRFELRGNY
mmetsp:Transcript_27149/g.49286  ORF Transcript_27149/g.49286 Transcript_27149/m.49286 type:complete len:566 (+) Transcript_27149:32-1729(+)|eukprot:CAMPEP_0196135506 /NCGR_PEP_ID=MMETSP0910-20130528/4121_1 /TAXON_ID=49265 /ORGANISM="Thalassiosira rotula, Strain GSO102" /LENGTH=565 /DNA_ID=CAMNT_0041395659 /DNA_START=15 /DNA_END=1712 /DNA_ORIENTATION=+